MTSPVPRRSPGPSVPYPNPNSNVNGIGTGNTNTNTNSTVVDHAKPPRRAFGSFSKSPARPSSAGSSSSTTPRSGTPTPTATTPTYNATLQPPAEPRRTRSSSSASSQDAFEAATNAATRAQAWLSNWAPRGEGRSREFLANTLNGVATVASTVSSGIGETVNSLEIRAALGSRAGSFSGGSPNVEANNSSSNANNSNSNTFNGALNGTSNQTNGNNGTLNPTSVSMSRGVSVSPPPIPTHTASTPAIPTSQLAPGARRIPQPANLSRLGTSPVISPPASSSTSNFHRPSLSLSNTATSTTSLPPSIPRSTSTTLPVQHHPHGPSHLNPNSHSRSTSNIHHHRSPSLTLQPGRGSPTPSRSSSTATGPWRTGLPYKIGFQPAGVKHDRTAEFQSDRKRLGEEREKEEGRLGRRWAKLVDLHFNPANSPLATASTSTMPRSVSSSSNLSVADKRRSLLSIDGALDALKTREMWKGIKGVANPPNQVEEARKRAAEQAIVKWEDDAEVKKCRICQSAFTLANRKHHCRVCGRIVCSLPPTPPTLLAVQVQLFAPADPSSSSSTNPQAALPPGTRLEKCSTLLVADWKTGRGQEVDEGFVGWMKVEDNEDGQESPGRGHGAASPAKRDRRKSRSSLMSLKSENGVDGVVTGPLPQQPKEVQVKGVRVCRECWATVSRKHKILDRQRTTGFARLYQALRAIQHEIEELTPEFEDQMEEAASTADLIQLPPQLLATHKHLLTLFSQYEHLSKRISNLPCDEGGSQATVQSAVARSGATFLAKEMVKVQALPRLQKRLAETKRKSVAILETTLAEQLKLEGVQDEAAEDVAVILQPLLEQEAQLEVYVADANAKRKYEDSKALSMALEEIRGEIMRITQRAVR